MDSLENLNNLNLNDEEAEELEEVDEAGEPEAEIPEEVEDSEQDLNELRSKISELEQELAVARADFYNYRQRVNKERQETKKRVQDDTVINFLPVLDNLDRALLVNENDTAKNVLIGVRMVQQQFLTALNDLGVSVIKTQGEKFNPSLHDAIATVPVENAELDGEIIDEQLRGYKSGEKVLRAARVTVGKFEN